MRHCEKLYLIQWVLNSVAQKTNLVTKFYAETNEEGGNQMLSATELLPLGGDETLFEWLSNIVVMLKRSIF